MRKLVLLSGFIISVFIFFHGCRIYRPKSKPAYPASSPAYLYNYRFKENDKLYIKSFQNNDSLFLENIKDIKFVLSPDSLIVFEDSITTKKFYKDYFELYEKSSSVGLYISKYSYDGSIISIFKYLYGNLMWRKVNENGTVYIKDMQLITPRM